MGWATAYIQKLKDGETIQFRPKGNSMSGKIENGDLVEVKPIRNHILKKGDIVLCKVKGSEYLHLISAIKDGRYQISNNRGHTNGWIGINSIFGIKV